MKQINEEITEDYVSFEIAQLLEEKGFDGDCDYWYDEYGERCCSPSVISVECWCPSQSLALKWLREVHNIFIEINVSIDLNGSHHFNYSILDKECKYIRKGYTSFDWNYEQAIEAAIDYVLKNLI